MSHFTTIETQLKSLETLTRALDRLEVPYIRAESGHKLGVKGLEKQQAEVDLEIKTGSAYSVGVRVGQDGTCELVADWWAIETFTGRTQTDFVDSLTREYAYVTVMDRVHDMGYSVVTEEESASKQIRLVVRKWS